MTNVQHIAANGVHTCAITKASAMYCWGSNKNGQIGVGTGNTWKIATVPVLVTQSGVAAIAMGALHGCMVTASGCPGK